MKMFSWKFLLLLVGIAVAGATIARAATKEVIWPAADIKYKEVVPGVSKVDLWGNSEKGAHGSLTKFVAGTTHALHTHTQDVKIVVFSGTFVYTAENGPETKLGPGSYVLIPGGKKHSSGCTADAECQFFEEQAGKFDMKMLGAKSASNPSETGSN